MKKEANIRRGELIHKYLQGTLTDAEVVEYEHLQKVSLIEAEKLNCHFFDLEDEEYERKLEEKINAQ